MWGANAVTRQTYAQVRRRHNACVPAAHNGQPTGELEVSKAPPLQSCSSFPSHILTRVSHVGTYAVALDMDLMSN